MDVVLQRDLLFMSEFKEAMEKDNIETALEVLLNAKIHENYWIESICSLPKLLAEHHEYNPTLSNHNQSHSKNKEEHLVVCRLSRPIFKFQYTGEFSYTDVSAQHNVFHYMKIDGDLRIWEDPNFTTFKAKYGCVPIRGFCCDRKSDLSKLGVEKLKEDLPVSFKWSSESCFCTMQKTSSLLILRCHFHSEFRVIIEIQKILECLQVLKRNTGLVEEVTEKRMENSKIEKKCAIKRKKRMLKPY